MVTVDELDWDSFPIDNLTMEVTSIEPIPSDEDNDALTELRFSVSRLVRGKEPTKSSTTSRSEFWDLVEEETGIRYKNGEILLSGDKNGKENLEAFVRFLIDSKRLTEVDLPYKSGYKRYLINIKDVHINGEKMSQPEEVKNGIYVETKYSKKDIKKKIEQLAEDFGY